MLGDRSHGQCDMLMGFQINDEQKLMYVLKTCLRTVASAWHQALYNRLGRWATVELLGDKFLRFHVDACLFVIRDSIRFLACEDLSYCVLTKLTEI